MNHENVQFYRKTINCWQSVLGVGLPIIFLDRVSHYVISCIDGGKSVGLPHPWRFAVIVDAVAIFILSTVEALRS
jgi:hypothetical protein